MRLAIFGATGGVGRNLVDQALSDGHQVTAFTRAPEKFGKPHPSLRLVRGDVRDPEAVTRAIIGQDAVLCALGMPLFNRDNLRTAGTKVIVDAMKKADVNRLICLTVMGAGESWSLLPRRYRYFIAPVILGRVIADHESQEQLIRESGLDWTIVRPGNFTEGTRTGDYQHGFEHADRSLKLKISRADVADFMMRQITDRSYLHRAAAISY